MSAKLNDSPSHFRLRIPAPLKVWINAEAEKHSGSINSEIVRALIGHRERVEKSRARRGAAQRERATA
jgi:hypothetical protein